MKYLVFIALYLVTFSAQKCGAQADQFNREIVVGITWYHSHEEDREDLKFYRPESYSFPPSRGRTGFKLLPDGSAIYKSIGPNDVPRDNKANWELSKDSTNLLLTIHNRASPNDSQRFEYKVVSCQENLVQLKSVDLDSKQTK